MADQDDPFLWLEEVHGADALAWVEAENARSLEVLKADPRYRRFEREALDILTAADRIAMPRQRGPWIYNFWQDQDHVRGLWRRTGAAEYERDRPVWETVLDLDALAAGEGANWVWAGADTLPPDHRRCLISLSDGGEDAKVVREFDLSRCAFVDGGFSLPKGKQSEDWRDGDTLLVAREWFAGALTASGYPFIVKSLERGQPLEAAVEVFRGSPEDVLVQPGVFHDGDGRVLPLILRAIDFFQKEVYTLSGEGVRRLSLPRKVELHGLLGGRLIFTILEDWRGLRAGSLLSAPPEDLAAEEEARESAFSRVIFEPGPRQSVEQVAVTAHRLLVAILDNVSGQVWSFAPALEGGWTPQRIETPALTSVGIASADQASDTAYVTTEGFLEPTHLWRVEAGSGERREVKRLPARFDAAKATVEQFQALSSDGVAIPYFVFRPKQVRADGDNPTILYAYGGFEISLTPAYSATIGRLWVEQGGVYVLANIRGGGEFGPAWHEAGLKTKRQIIYDDFAAVAHDLIARKITSPRRLGIQGGSNGGLLMGVQFNQRPELWRAVAIEVPLLDMLRFEKIGAGASWAAEYGSVEVADERSFLERISPYHNLRAGAPYPEPLFVTATSDDRVSPVHARKMAAKMHAMGLPYLFFENTDGGHAASANLTQRAERIALEFTYFAQKLMD